MTPGVLLSVFMLALLGGVHCAAMCGGIALVVEAGDRAAPGAPVPPPVPPPVPFYRSRGAWLRELLVLHAGRLTMYAVLGAVLGAVGAGAWKAQYLPLQRALFAAGSGTLVLAGLWMLGADRAVRRMRAESGARVAATLWTSIARRVAVRPRRGPVWHATPTRRLLRRYAAGLAWGLVPCGMVYGALALALLAGNGPSGALVMLVFGAGTLPNLLVLSGLSAWLRGLARRPWVRRAGGAAVALFGVAGMARAVMLPDMLAVQGFCLSL